LGEEVDEVVRRSRSGFTLVEMIVVVGIAAVLVAMAVPAMDAWSTNQRAKSAIRSVANALSTGRSEAIRTGNHHIVFFQLDAQGNPLLDGEGVAVPLAIVNDDRPGGPNQNCTIDANETVGVGRAEPGIAWGVANASARVPTDFGTGSIATGSSFTDTSGNAAPWVLFRPDGVPISFAPACTLGGTGSGVGAIYVSNGRRDYAAVLTALGGIRTHAWDNGGGQWTN
jgi:prepilin-type N-terminal cleavage/methylation domain-containing protein